MARSITNELRGAPDESNARLSGVPRERPEWRWKLIGLAAACYCIVWVLDAGAAALDVRKIDKERFVARYWSQSRPNLHYAYGCDTGWHSFSFRTDGFFVFDGKVAGSWWIDHLRNIGLVTNDGERVVLFYDGGKVLTQRQRSADTPNSVFGQEFRTYRECDTDKVRLH
jgi:hypothetical protein